MCVCVVLFVASKTFDKSELLSCLLEMGVEYYLVCIREGLLCGKGVGGARESQLLGCITTKLFSKILDLSILLSVCRAHMYMFGW